MRVILLADLKGTGKKDQVIEVSDGYARNYLFPKKLAAEANATNMNAIEKQKSAIKHRDDVKKQQAEDLARELKSKIVRVSVRAGEQGRLFGSITSQEIATALEAQHGYSIDKRKIELEAPIHAVGEYVADIKLMAGVTSKIVVKVEAAGK